ncbi:MAG TPA: hypothetical protein VNO31_52145 [Umezawaea sp.]|nr:hypothetical protein [Umezawaea sp.]
MNRYLGYREALAPAGLDDSRVARMTRPLDERPDLDAMAAGALTAEALGREMTRMLVRLISGERPTPLILPTELVIRDSA